MQETWQTAYNTRDQINITSNETCPTSALLLNVINTYNDQDTWTMCIARHAPNFKMDLKSLRSH